jgi:hypothetical protein
MKLKIITAIAIAAAGALWAGHAQAQVSDPELAAVNALADCYRAVDLPYRLKMYPEDGHTLSYAEERAALDEAEAGKDKCHIAYDRAMAAIRR